MKVRDVMSSPVTTVGLDTPFHEIVGLLLDHGYSCVPVLDGRGRLAGIISEADLVTNEAYGAHRRALQILRDLLDDRRASWLLKSRGTTARELMSTHLKVTRSDADLRAVARRMVLEGIKRFPVVDDGELVGIVSRRDVLRLYDRPDEELESEVGDHLANPLWSPEDADLDVHVHDGVVHVTGSVEHPMDLPVVEAAIWAVPGVIAVVDDDVVARTPDPSAA